MPLTALALLASTFFLVFCLGLQSLLVNSGHRAFAFANSFAIGAANLTLFKLAPDAGGIEIAAYLCGGPFGIEHGEKLFEFRSKQDWINKAQRIWRFHEVRAEHTVCVDQLGRICGWGKHFADAERDNAYPIEVFRLRQDMTACQRLS